MRVLVTGSTGYIGTVMVPRLLAAGHEVTGLDSGLFADCVLGPEPAPVPLLKVDVRDVTAEDLQGHDAVIHLAALSNDPLGDIAPEHTHDINHHASVRLARLARDAGVTRFLYASSCSVYGATGADELLDEGAAMRPVTPYAVSKVRVEADLVDLAGPAFCPVLLRNATVYGWSPRLRSDIVLNDLVGRALLTGVVTVLSDGTPWRPLVHVEDVATAFLAALEAPADAVRGEAFNVGRSIDNHRVRDIAEVVGGVVPGCRIEITGEHGSDPRSYRVNFSKLERRLPDCRLTWDIGTGAQQLYDAYRTHGLTQEGFTQWFRRLPRLQKLQEAGRLGEDLRWISATGAGAGA